MQAYRFAPVLLTLAGGILAGCHDDTTTTEPATSAAVPAAGPAAALVGTPNTWEKVALMPTARHSAVASAAVNANGKSIVYVFGGSDITDPDGIRTFGSVEAYNIANDRWTTRAGIAPFKTSAINGANMISGKFYLPGGGVNTGNGFLKLRVLQVYDPATDSWTRKADMPGASSRGVSGVIDGKLYVVTGEDNTYLDGGVPCEDCGVVQTRRLFRYDPAQNRWTRRKPCPHFHISGAAGVIDGKLYVAGGQSTLTLDIYNPMTDTWSSGAPLPSAHSGGAGVVLAGQLYVVGGFTGAVVAYNPTTNRWVNKASFPVPTSRFMAAAKATLDGKARIVAQVGLEDGFPNNGRATFVYTP